MTTHQPRVTAPDKVAVSYEIERRDSQTVRAYALNAHGHCVQTADCDTEQDAAEWAQRRIAKGARS